MMKPYAVMVFPALALLTIGQQAPAQLVSKLEAGAILANRDGMLSEDIFSLTPSLRFERPNYRVSASGSFDEILVPIPEGYAVTQGASLSADGLRLILPRDDFTGFGELSRTTRGSAFGLEVDEGRFARVNTIEPMSGQQVAWPVQSSDGKALYFVSYFGQAWVRYSELALDDTFSVGTEIDEFTLGGKVGHYKRL